mgnify:CR=1 FL=1
MQIVNMTVKLKINNVGDFRNRLSIPVGGINLS